MLCPVPMGYSTFIDTNYETVPHISRPLDDPNKSTKTTTKRSKHANYNLGRRRGEHHTARPGRSHLETHIPMTLQPGGDTGCKSVRDYPKPDSERTDLFIDVTGSSSSHGTKFGTTAVHKQPHGWIYYLLIP